MTNLPEEVLSLLREAETAQQEAWLDLDYTLCGIDIRQMTLRDFFLLDGLGSPFLRNEPYTIADIGVFFWVLSKEFKPCEKARDTFCRKIKDIKIAKAEEEIHKYLDITFTDADTAGGGKGKQYSTYVSYQIDLYAKEYGWTISEIMKIPMRQVFQLNTAIGERYAKGKGETYTKLRQIDMIEAKALLKQARENKIRNN